MQSGLNTQRTSTRQADLNVCLSGFAPTLPTVPPDRKFRNRPTPPPQLNRGVRCFREGEAPAEPLVPGGVPPRQRLSGRFALPGRHIAAGNPNPISRDTVPRADSEIVFCEKSRYECLLYRSRDRHSCLSRLETSSESAGERFVSSSLRFWLSQLGGRSQCSEHRRNSRQRPSPEGGRALGGSDLCCSPRPAALQRGVNWQFDVARRSPAF